MGKRKDESQKKSAPRKKVKQDEGAATTPATMQAPTIAPPTVTESPATGLPIAQPEGEEPITPTQVQVGQDPVIMPQGVSEVQSSTTEPTETARNGAMLDPDTLKRIFYEIILRPPPDTTPGEFGRTPWHFTGYEHPAIHCTARATLRGVCKLWADLIADEINLWRYIHIDGKRIPSPPKTWMKGRGREPENYAEPREDDWNDLEVVHIVGEMPRAALSVERSQDTPIDLVLVDPSYDPEPDLAEFGRPFLPRPALLELIDAAMVKPMIGSLSISTGDVHFVKDLFDHGVHSHERRVYDDEMEELTDAKKISLACDGEATDHFDLSTLPPSTSNTFTGIRTRTQRQIEEANATLRKKFTVWPALHTLRICIQDESWIDDHQRCALPAALRHLELELYDEHPLWLWTFPYPQLTHLTLATEEPSTILLGIVARCAALESLTITLRNSEETDNALTVKHIVLAYLGKLSVLMASTYSNKVKVGRHFLDHIRTPRLQSLEVITRNVNRAYPIIHLLTRSQCQLRELRLDFSSSFLKGSLKHEGVLDTERFNLHELLHFVSPTLETLAIQSGPMDGLTWLEGFAPPHLQTLTMVCFGVEKWVFMMDEPDDISAAHDAALCVLRWAEEWMKLGAKSENSDRTSKRSVEFVARAKCTRYLGLRDGTEAFYGRDRYFKCEQVPCPDTVDAMVSRISKMGGNVNVVWTTIRQATADEVDTCDEEKAWDYP